MLFVMGCVTLLKNLESCSRSSELHRRRRFIDVKDGQALCKLNIIVDPELRRFELFWYLLREQDAAIGNWQLI